MDSTGSAFIEVCAAFIVLAVGVLTFAVRRVFDRLDSLEDALNDLSERIANT